MIIVPRETESIIADCHTLIVSRETGSKLNEE